MENLSRASLVGDQLLYSLDHNFLIHGWYGKEKLDVSHAHSGLKGLTKKAREKSGKWSDMVQFGGWRDSFSSALRYVLW